VTDSKLASLLKSASAEPIAPEFDPVWEQASALLQASSVEVADDSEAVARTLRAVRLDAHARSPRHWVPFVVAVVASALAFFALAEAVVPHARPVSSVVDQRR